MIWSSHINLWFGDVKKSKTPSWPCCRWSSGRWFWRHESERMFWKRVGHGFQNTNWNKWEMAGKDEDEKWRLFEVSTFGFCDVLWDLCSQVVAPTVERAVRMQNHCAQPRDLRGRFRRAIDGGLFNHFGKTYLGIFRMTLPSGKLT